MQYHGSLLSILLLLTCFIFKVRTKELADSNEELVNLQNDTRYNIQHSGYIIKNNKNKYIKLYSKIIPKSTPIYDTNDTITNIKEIETINSLDSYSFEKVNERIEAKGKGVVVIPLLDKDITNADKRAITPVHAQRRHHSHRRLPTPQKDIAPTSADDGSSGSGQGPDELPLSAPLPPTPPPPPSVIIPPPAPATPIVINTAPGPTVNFGSDSPSGAANGAGVPPTTGDTPAINQGTNGESGPAGGGATGEGAGPVGSGPDWDGAGGTTPGAFHRPGYSGEADGGTVANVGDKATDSKTPTPSISAGANEQLKKLENVVQALVKKVDNEDNTASTPNSGNPAPEGALDDMLAKITSKINTLSGISKAPVEQDKPNGFDASPVITGGRPTQVATGFLDAQLIQLNGIMNGLGSKLDTITYDMQKKPTDLERASLLAGMTTTFGGLQNTMDTLSDKIVEGIKRPVHHVEQQPDKDAEATALLASKIGKLDGSMSTLGEKIKLLSNANSDSIEKAQQFGMNAERIKSNARLEEGMKGLADGMIRLGEKLNKPIPTLKPPILPPILVEQKPPQPLPQPPPEPPPPPPPPTTNPKVDEQQNQLMTAQTDLTKQMTDIQKGIAVLSDALKTIKDKPPPKPEKPEKPPFMDLAKEALKSASESFKDIAKASEKSNEDFAKNIDKSVTDAGKLLKTDNFIKLFKKLPTGSAAAITNAFAGGGGGGGGVFPGIGGLSTAAGGLGLGEIGGGGFPGIGGLSTATGGLGLGGIGGISGLGLGTGAIAGLGSLPLVNTPPMAPFQPIPAVPAVNMPDMLSALKGSASVTPAIGGNPLNFGTHGNGTPQLGVVTGNLGGSLGLGGIGGIDGGNALTMNQTTTTKKRMICKGITLNCFWKGFKRQNIASNNRNYMKTARKSKYKRKSGKHKNVRRSKSMKSNIRLLRRKRNVNISPKTFQQETVSVKSFVIRPISSGRPIANRVATQTLTESPKPASTSSISPIASVLNYLKSMETSARSESPKQTSPNTTGTGSNMAAAISNLLTQRLSDKQKYGPKIISASVASANAPTGPLIDPSSIATGITSGIVSGTQTMLHNLGEQLNLGIGDAAAQGAVTGNAMSSPKDGSVGTGTGGYTSSLGRFNDHIGYGNGLFGPMSTGGESKGSGMVTPDAAAGKIAAMSTVANQASTATSNTAKMIQDNLWGRGKIGPQDVSGNEHMKEWTKFFGELPHHDEKGLTMADEHHGEDHNKHYFDHGEHGTGEDTHHHVYGHHTEYGHHDEWGFGDTGQFGHHHKWEEGPNGVFEHFGDWGKEHEGNGHQEEHHQDHHDDHHHEDHHDEGHHDGGHGHDGGHNHDHDHTHHDHGHYHYIEVEHGHHDGGGDHGHHGDNGWFGHHGNSGSFGGEHGGGYSSGMRRGGDNIGHEVHEIMHDTGDIQGDIGGTYNGGFAGDGGGGGGYGGGGEGGSYGGGGGGGSYGGGGGSYGGGGGGGSYGGGGGGVSYGGGGGGGSYGGGGGGYGEGGGDSHHDDGDIGYHHNGEYGRLHLPVESLLDHHGHGHNLRPLHALHDLHQGRNHRFHEAGTHGNENNHEQSHEGDFLSHGLSHHGSHHLNRLHHHYHPEGIGHHYEYHQDHDDDIDHGNHHNYHHDDHMEDEHDTDHSHHIGWVHHGDDDREDHHYGGERHGGHHDSGSESYEGGHHGDDDVHDHYDNEMEHHEGEGHQTTPVDSTAAGFVNSNNDGMSTSHHESCRRSDVNGDCSSAIPDPVKINLKPKNDEIASKDINEIQNIINGHPFHKEYDLNDNTGDHHKHSHEDIDIGQDQYDDKDGGNHLSDKNDIVKYRGDDNENMDKSNSPSQRKDTEYDDGEPKPKDVTDANFIDNLLPNNYKEDEQKRVQDKMKQETDALVNLYNHSPNDIESKKGPEEVFMEKASRLTGTPWGLQRRQVQRSFIQKKKAKNYNSVSPTLNKLETPNSPSTFQNSIKRNSFNEEEWLLKQYKPANDQKTNELREIQLYDRQASSPNIKMVKNPPSPKISLEEPLQVSEERHINDNGNGNIPDIQLSKELSKAGDHLDNIHGNNFGDKPIDQTFENEMENNVESENQPFNKNIDQTKITSDFPNLHSDLQNQISNPPTDEKSDQLLPKTYKEDEENMMHEKLDRENLALQSVFDQESHQKHHNKLKTEEIFVGKIAQLTDTQWGLNKRHHAAKIIKNTKTTSGKRTVLTESNTQSFPINQRLNMSELTSLLHEGKQENDFSDKQNNSTSDTDHDSDKPKENFSDENNEYDYRNQHSTASEDTNSENKSRQKERTTHKIPNIYWHGNMDNPVNSYSDNVKVRNSKNKDDDYDREFYGRHENTHRNTGENTNVSSSNNKSYEKTANEKESNVHNQQHDPKTSNNSSERENRYGDEDEDQYDDEQESEHNDMDESEDENDYGKFSGQRESKNDVKAHNGAIHLVKIPIGLKRSKQILHFSNRLILSKLPFKMNLYRRNQKNSVDFAGTRRDMSYFNGPVNSNPQNSLEGSDLSKSVQELQWLLNSPEKSNEQDNKESYNEFDNPETDRFHESYRAPRIRNVLQVQPNGDIDRSTLSAEKMNVNTMLTESNTEGTIDKFNPPKESMEVSTENEATNEFQSTFNKYQDDQIRLPQGNINGQIKENPLLTISTLPSFSDNNAIIDLPERYKYALNRAGYSRGMLNTIGGAAKDRDEKHFPQHENHNGHSLHDKTEQEIKGEDKEKEIDNLKEHELRFHGNVATDSEEKLKSHSSSEEDLGELKGNHDHKFKGNHHDRYTHEQQKEHSEGLSQKVDHEKEPHLKEYSEHHQTNNHDEGGSDDTEHENRDGRHSEHAGKTHHKHHKHHGEEHDDYEHEHHQTHHHNHAHNHAHHRHDDADDNDNLDKNHHDIESDDHDTQEHFHHNKHDHDDIHHDSNDEGADEEKGEESDEHHLGEDIHGWSGYAKDHLKLMNPKFIDSLIPSEMKELEEKRLKHKVDKETNELINLFQDISDHKIKEPESKFIGEASHLIGTKWGLNGNLGYKVYYPHIPHNKNGFHRIVVNINEHGVNSYNSRDDYDYDKHQFHDQHENALKRSMYNAKKYKSRTRNSYTVKSNTYKILNNLKKRHNSLHKQFEKQKHLRSTTSKVRKKRVKNKHRVHLKTNVNYKYKLAANKRTSVTRLSPYQVIGKKTKNTAQKKGLVFENCGFKGHYKDSGEFDVMIDDMKFKSDCSRKEKISDGERGKDGVRRKDGERETDGVRGTDEERGVNNEQLTDNAIQAGGRLLSELNNEDIQRFGNPNVRKFDQNLPTSEEKSDKKKHMLEKNQILTFSTSKENLSNEKMIEDGGSNKKFYDSLEKPFYKLNGNQLDDNTNFARKDTTHHDDNTESNKMLQWDQDERADNDLKHHGENVDDEHEKEHEEDKHHQFEDKDEHKNEHAEDKEEGEEHHKEMNDHLGDHDGGEHNGEKEEHDDIDDHKMITGHYHPHKITHNEENHDNIDDQFHNHMSSSRGSERLPRIGFTMNHLHGPEIGFSKNENVEQGYHGNSNFGHVAGEHNDGDHGLHGESHSELPIGYYGPLDQTPGLDSTVSNEGHTVPIFTYGGGGEEGGGDGYHGHKETSGFHHGIQDGIPIDDHPAHYLFRHFAPGGTIGDDYFQHSLDDHIRHHEMHGGLDNHHGDGLANQDNHHLHELDYRLVNPLDYRLPMFPQRKNNPMLDQFFERETARIVQHVNEFPLISDKQSVHPSVFRDQMNVLPSISDFDAFSIHGMHHMKSGGRYGAGGTLVGAGTVGYGAVGRPSIGIGLAAGGSAGAGALMGGKPPPLNAILQKAQSKGHFPLSQESPQLTSVGSIINSGFPQFHIPKSEPVAFEPDIIKPLPNPFGPNPYQLLTSEALGMKPLDIPPPKPPSDKNYKLFNKLISEGKPDPKPEEEVPPDSPPSIVADPKPPPPTPPPPPPKPPPKPPAKPPPEPPLTSDTKKAVRKDIFNGGLLSREVPKAPIPKLVLAFNEMTKKM